MQMSSEACSHSCWTGAVCVCAVPSATSHTWPACSPEELSGLAGQTHLWLCMPRALAAAEFNLATRASRPPLCS